MKFLLLAGVSAFALATTAAHAVTFATPGETAWIVPTSGTYQVDVWGAQGGSSVNFAGGEGAGLAVDVSLVAGESVDVFVGARGGQGAAFTDGSGGGGGSSAALFGPVFSDGVIAGGGGGGAYFDAGGAGVAPASGGPGGAGHGGGYGGISGSPGGYAAGAPGGGLRTYFPVHNAYGPFAGKGFFDGGAGGAGYMYGGAGGAGFSGGGGASYGGGGGGGYSGGGGGGNGDGGGGGGSYSFVGPSTSLAFKTGDGEVTINAAVPEPTTWSLMISGFGFLGYCLRRRFARVRSA